MQSYVLLFSAANDAIVPSSNGYLMFSMLCALVRNTPLDAVFHPSGEDGAQDKRALSIGFLRPASESETGDSRHDLHFSAGEAAAARVSFLSDDDAGHFAEVLSRYLNKTVRLGHGIFTLKAILHPGEHPLAISLDLEQLLSAPPSETVGFKFLSPTGFKRNGKQFFLPLPELVFGDLLYKWKRFVGEPPVPTPEEIPAQIEIARYDIESRAAKLREDRVFRGFRGEVEYAARPFTPAARSFISALASLAFFSGVGYKTTQGLGESLPFWREG